MNTNEKIINSSKQHSGESKRKTGTYLGASGEVTGRLHWDPLAYPCKDGSVTFLFQVDVVSSSGNPNNRQAQDSVRLMAHIPAGFVEFSPFVWLRQGSLVTAQYVVRTDYYRDSDGEPTRKTYLDVRELYRHDEPGTVQPKDSPQRFETQGRQCRDQAGYSAGRNSPRGTSSRRNPSGHKSPESLRSTQSPGGRSHSGSRGLSAPAPSRHQGRRGISG